MTRKEQIREILFILLLLKLFYGSKIKRKKQFLNLVNAFLRGATRTLFSLFYLIAKIKRYTKEIIFGIVLYLLVVIPN